MVSIMDEIISYKMCAVKVRNAKLRNYLKAHLHDAIFAYDCCMQLADAIPATRIVPCR